MHPAPLCYEILHKINAAVEAFDKAKETWGKEDTGHEEVERHKTSIIRNFNGERLLLWASLDRAKGPIAEKLGKELDASSTSLMQVARGNDSGGLFWWHGLDPETCSKEEVHIAADKVLLNCAVKEIGLRRKACTSVPDS